MLKERVLSAMVFGPLILGLTYLGGAWYLAGVVAMVVLAGYEYLRLARTVKGGTSYPLGMAMILVALLAVLSPPEVGRALIGLSIILSLTWYVIVGRIEGSMEGWALTFGGALYIGLLGGHFVLLRNLPRGLEWTLFAFFITWANDTGAYFGGRFFGRRPFAPKVSPKKTWEGTIGGWALGLVIAWLGGRLLAIPLPVSVGYGVLIVLAAVMGDLAESLVKRWAGVKDSGDLIPGHGGVLDRMDSLLFVVPVAYSYILWVYAV